MPNADKWQEERCIHVRHFLASLSKTRTERVRGQEYLLYSDEEGFGRA
jgi:hypothetical protein